MKVQQVIKISHCTFLIIYEYLLLSMLIILINIILDLNYNNNYNINYFNINI